MPYNPLNPLKFAGKSATGEVFEQDVEITRPDNNKKLQIRRVVVELKTPTRNDDQQLILLTNLPKEVKTLTVAELYHARWGIETAFQKLESHLHSEINTLGYPKAALFSFCLALVAFNLHAIVMAALRVTHPEESINETVSEYYIAQEIEATTEGMLIAIPEKEWTIFTQVNLVELGGILLDIASYVDLKKYEKTPRGPKKPRMERNQFKGHTHVSTAKLIKGIKPKVVAAKVVAAKAA